MANALYICYFGVREPLVQTQVIPYLRELAKGGHEMTLLTFESGDKVAELQSYGVAKLERDLADLGIKWHWLRYHKRPTVPATFYDVMNGARYVRRLMKGKRIDILHARAHIPAVMAALARMGLSSRPKLLFDIRGFVPEEYTDAGIWPEGGWLYRTVKRVERWLMREADGFVVLTEKAREILFSQSRQSGLDKFSRPVEVIPCCVDLKRFEAAGPESRARIRSELGIGDRFVLAYVGSFGGWYMTNETADLFGVAKSRENSTFAMILTQGNPELIESLLAARGFCAGDFFIRRVPVAEIPVYLSAADAAVSFIKPCYSKHSSSPTKNAEYLASGLPVIGNAGVGDVDELIEQNRVGALVREFSGGAYRGALDEIERLGDVRDRCRETARREFDLETVGGERYWRLYRHLVGE